MADPRGEAGIPDLMDAFRDTAKTYPDRPALVHGEQTITYRELAGQVDELASRLVTATPGVIAVEATHAPATIRALLAVWAAGGAYCPVDPAFPAPRRAAMLAAAECQAILDPRTDELTVLEPRPRPDADTPADLAYVLFTSGSTGAPKPVLTQRPAIAVTVAALRRLFEVTPDDRVLQFASLNWDTCFEEILPALTSGAALVFHEDAHSGSLPRVLRMIERERISVLDLPTAFWHELVAYLVEEGAALPGCVRLVVIGGEAASTGRLDDWCDLHNGHIRLLNTYGSTETTLITHAIDLAGPRARSRSWSTHGRAPLGVALAHVRERVTDDGELLIGGPAVAFGYRGLPEATASRFVELDGERFFRTGDRVERVEDADGTVLVPRGRLDGEVKIRGIRVDPAEVEAHIGMHPAVRAVAVTGVRQADHTVLAAFVVARPGAHTTDLAASIRSHLRGRLPAHLVPHHIRVVADLVYTSSGKVDRHRIKEALA